MLKQPMRFLTGGAGGGDSAADAGLMLLRLFAGLALAFAHGLGKVPPGEGFVGFVASFGLPLPTVFAWLAGIAEFGGGLLLAVGFMTRGAAILVLLNMSFALIFAHILQGDPFGAMELAMFFWFTALCFALTGAGRFSIDGLIRRRVEMTTVSRFVRH